MIWNARSLQKVARELASGRVPPEEDAFLFPGQQLAEPILLALATEIALNSPLIKSAPSDSLVP